MNKKVLACLSVMLPLIVFAEVEDLEAEYYRALPGKCIATEDPLNCLGSYGYVCDQFKSGQISVAAFYLSCNAYLSNGRKHFAQLLFDGVGWAVETQRVYIPDRATNACLAEGWKRRSGEYRDCLRLNGVKVGCEMQPDGSRLCY